MKSLLKSVQVYNIEESWSFDRNTLEEALEHHSSKPLGRMDMKNIGWDSFDNGEQVITSGHNVLIRLIERKKVVPPAAVKEAMKKEIAKFEAYTGMPPKAKEKRNMKESVLMQILPKALEVSKHIHVVLNTDKKRLYIEASSTKAADDIAALIIKTLGINITPIDSSDMVALMTNWMLRGESEDGSLKIGDSCGLEAVDEKKSKVKFSKVDLNAEECKEHVNLGYRVMEIEMYIDGCVNFTVNKDFVIKKISFDNMFAEEIDYDDEISNYMASMEVFVDSMGKIQDSIFAD